MDKGSEVQDSDEISLILEYQLTMSSALRHLLHMSGCDLAPD